MGTHFEELDYRPTPMGVLSLRRRRDLLSGGDIYEIKLDDEFLMSSLFTASEIALARLGLAALPGLSLDVIVGGLGLGYTARAVLEHAQVGSLLVVDALAEVIEWHHRGLLPLGAELTSDPRCRLVLGDFFAGAASEAGFDAEHPGRRYHAILVDIDHSPKNVLHPSHSALYTIDGLTRLAAHLHPSGVFGLWSNDPPDDELQQSLREVFATSEAHTVAFDNMRKDGEVTNTVYVATSGH
ncbi:spermidine synthase [Microvirga aerilata]|uniref:Spermidine synthase n=1 Tax=Microvirga aerilata TaxID=670292 RepID=A0A936ZCJ3_9HYPH|nr:spermidine synthase [Microvirga aerilata]MBL0407321.1 spermidine synthase [Microvirga aerilata]